MFSDLLTLYGRLMLHASLLLAGILAVTSLAYYAALAHHLRTRGGRRGV